MPFTVIVPAAGRGGRFGSQKLLADVEGERLLDRTLASLLDAGAASLVVVVAATTELAELRRLRDPRVSVVVNPEPDRGMFSSIQVGLAAAAGASVVVILPGDMPYVRAATVDAVAAECAAIRQVVIPAYTGCHGHPVAVPLPAGAALLAADSRSTLKAELQWLGLDQRILAVDDPGVLRDVDTRSDLERWSGTRAMSVERQELFVSDFAELPDAAGDIAGGKGASLSRLGRAGFPVPPGFVVCTPAFQTFLEETSGHDFLRAQMTGVTVEDPRSLADVSRAIREFILSRPLPAAVDDHLRRGYERLGGATVAVRSSAVGEDGEGASFAGQHDTFLGVRGADAVTTYVRECWASFFTERALFYRSAKGTLTDPRVAVVVQQMVAADASGVMFTADPVQKRRDHIVIEAVIGLGEGIVSGVVTPDHHVVDRATGAIVREFIGVKEVAFVYDTQAGGTIEEPLSDSRKIAPVLSASDLDRLRDLGVRLESFFGQPQDIEWSLCGGELFLLQSRPITTL